MPTGVRASDYIQTGTLTEHARRARRVTACRSTRCSAARGAAGGGQTETNRPGYHQRYWGLEFSATKRLSNRWMARLGFSTNDWREYFDDPALSIIDPTPAPATGMPQPAVRRPAGRRRPGRAEVGRQRQEQHLPGRAEVSDRRQRRRIRGRGG